MIISRRRVVLTPSVAYAHRTVYPLHYAHLAAFHALVRMELETSDIGSMASGIVGRGATVGSGGPRSNGPGAGATVKPLLTLKNKVKRVMFYC